MSRRSLRRKPEFRKGRFVFAFLAVVCAVIGVWLSVNNRAYSVLPEEGPSSVSTTAPQPDPLVLVSPTPVPTLAPTPTPTAEPKPWTFEGATLTIPKVGIDQRPVTEYTKDNLVTESVYSDELGRQVDVPDSIVPDGAWSIAWYSSVSAGGSILSSTATNTVYFYGHSYGWEPAIFNDVPTLQPGDQIVVQTPTERLTYTMDRPSFQVGKIDLRTDKRYTERVAGRLIIVTCYRTGERDANGHALLNTVSTFQLTQSESLVPRFTSTSAETVSRLQ